MMTRPITLILFICLLLSGTSALAAPQGEVSTARLAALTRAVTPGTPFGVALRIGMQPGWHTYADPPGDAGLAARLEWTLPPGFSAGPIAWPPAQSFTEGQFTTYGYKGAVTLPVQITPPKRLEEGGTVPIALKASWLVCNDQCIPQEAEFSLNLPVSSAQAQAHPPPPPATATPHSWGWTLLLALAGGVILNLMPCVFPVLSLKCLAVVKQSELSRSAARREGLAYLAGILVCFAAILGALLALQRSGEAVGWGFQMQSPAFVAGMALLLFTLGLSLSGIFTLPALLGNVGHAHASAGGMRGSFFTGMLATLVATPCTAPLMAPALGAALTLPPALAFVTFEMVGVGLALPFLMVSFFPALRRLLPRPGAWMVRFKELLAFPLYASAIWLVWVLAQQAGPNSVGGVLLGMLGMAFALWLKPGSRLRRGAVLLLIITSVAGTLGYVSWLPPQKNAALPGNAQPFSTALLNRLQAAGRPVFVDVTAAWCITCRVNYFSTLTHPQVQRAFSEKNIQLLVADWTNRDAAITAYLAEHQAAGVPLYVYYPSRKPGKILPQLLSPAIVIDALE